MSESHAIYLDSGLSIEETAQRLAEVLGGHVVQHDNGEIAVRRPAAADPVRSIGGEVTENEDGEEDPVPGDEAVYDRYDLGFELWLSGRTDEEMLHAESARIFDEIVAALPWPAVHVNVNGLLHSAWKPGLGRTDFPPRTSYAASSRALWEPYAHP
jgi:hypothetical protein